MLYNEIYNVQLLGIIKINLGHHINIYYVVATVFRGLTRSLWVGVLIAVPSGAGVALSILGGNIGSLVGVAISASLLPPAVNAASIVCWYHNSV